MSWSRFGIVLSFVTKRMHMQLNFLVIVDFFFNCVQNRYREFRSNIS
jgi:hypothetical protein